MPTYAALMYVVVGVTSTVIDEPARVEMTKVDPPGVGAVVTDAAGSRAVARPVPARRSPPRSPRRWYRVTRPEHGHEIATHNVGEHRTRDATLFVGGRGCDIDGDRCAAGAW